MLSLARGRRAVVTRPEAPALLLALLIGACANGTIAGPSRGVDLARTPPGVVLQLDDNPLYYTRITADYGFDAYRQHGMPAGSTSRAAAGPVRLPTDRGWACTCFTSAPSAQGPLFGRNFDYRHQASLLLYTSPSGAFSSISMVDIYYLGFSTLATLDDLRARPDFVARAPYLPMDGVNERGVAIGLMSVPTAEPPYDPGKVTLYDLALIRLVLDYATDANHAVGLLASYNYRIGADPVHFLVADRSGGAALVEYVHGAMQVSRPAEPFMVATNFVVFGSQAPSETPCARFDRAYSALSQKGGVLSRPEAFDLLSAVSQSFTMWSAVYNLNTLSIDVVPGRRYGSVYRLTMN